MATYDDLDWRRHFQELVGQVLPIFAIVGVLALVVWVAFGPEKKHEFLEPEAERVSLLGVGEAEASGKPYPFDPKFVLISPRELAKAPRSPRFDPPMGGEQAALTYNAQPFGTNRHLGDDINGIGGGDSDLGDPVYAVADGMVVYAGWASDGWGHVVTLLHRLPDGRLRQSFYAHLDQMRVPVGASVRRGEVIGTVGKADGRYLAHLHFEIRDHTGLAAGAGYADGSMGREAGERFLDRHRGAAEERLNAPPSGSRPEDTEASLEISLPGES